MAIRETLALVGNPNSGKTTLFNALTGAKQHIGNWPGVTVERKSGRLKADNALVIQDLPGTYSLSPYSSEEIVTRDFLLNDQPDLVLNVVDATNLERNLYLTLQVMETGRPLIVALNMMDVLVKTGHRTINLKS
ncbi:ferrous iron transport protein B [Lacticaseibacillus paracasei]|nr:ferrous iron transport protein B [Lacticaseibacillus paracasei]